MPGVRLHTDRSECNNCGERILAGAKSCPHCGQSQIPDDTSPWTCEVCANDNPWDFADCGECNFPRGTPSLNSPEYLQGKSEKADELSIRGCSVQLVDGSASTPIDVEVFLSREH